MCRNCTCKLMSPVEPDLDGTKKFMRSVVLCFARRSVEKNFLSL